MADEQNELPKIRTFKTDTEEFIKEKKISRLDIAGGQYVAGLDANETFKPRRQIPYKTAAYAVFVVAVVGLAGYFGFRLFSPAVEQPTVEAPKPFLNFLPVEDQKIIAISETSPGALMSAFAEERAKSLRFDTLIYFPIKILKAGGEEKFIDPREFAGFLNWRAPKEFLDNLEPDFNAMVFYGADSHDLAVILKVKNFERALASLLDWEKTMWFDWKPFLADEDIKNISQFSFKDEIIKNNDARVFRDGGGKIILGYSIFNKQHVVISTSRAALSTILSRLIALPPR